MHTTHGHQIPNTPSTEVPLQVARCGGVDRCKMCKAEVAISNLLNSRQELAKTKAMHLARCFIDGWYLVRDGSIPYYDLLVVKFNYQERDGQWIAHVQPVNSPHTDVKVQYYPHVRKFGISGTNIQSVILVDEKDA